MTYLHVIPVLVLAIVIEISGNKVENFNSALATNILGNDFRFFDDVMYYCTQKFISTFSNFIVIFLDVIYLYHWRVSQA
ncbi:hypothetical protein [Rickettsia typhi]|nr:hypothetical protein [Rickettsia typhi]AFE54386.1 hypothetical protein RTTH1527_02605 [Rickettsia typhi str. TH1527]AFE55224.1 hypothetical protein RTB9991CWPP_02605 [Rickettsia typhi str. B9991CWPP]